MELKNIIKSFILLVVYILLLAMVSCGPVIISSRPSHPPPAWFYPNRLEIVRYVYFPDYSFYYDLSTRSYVYIEGGVWIRKSSPPPQYRNIDLRRSRYNRIRNYSDDNISKYHNEYSSRGRTNRNNK